MSYINFINNIINSNNNSDNIALDDASMDKISNHFNNVFLAWEHLETMPYDLFDYFLKISAKRRISVNRSRFDKVRIISLLNDLPLENFRLSNYV